MDVHVKFVLLIQQIILISLVSVGYCSCSDGGNTTVPTRKTFMTEPQEGFRLKGKIVKELKAVSFIMCTQRCLSYPTCQSTNVLVRDETFPVVDICELIQDNVDNVAGELVASPGWIYSKVIKMTICPLGYNYNVDLDVCVVSVQKSCNDFWNNGHRNNGMYNIERAGLIYCHMVNIAGCGDGGWTQVIKMDGSKNTFASNSPLWTNNMTHKADISQGLGNSEVKTTAYWTIPFEKVCVGMKVSNDLKWILIQHRSLSLYHAIADGKYRATSLGRQTWKSLINGSSLQLNCNREGFNVNCSWDVNIHQPLRIGIKTNEQDDCTSCDSEIGFGRIGGQSCGNIAKRAHGGDNGYRNTAAWGYIFVQ